MEGSGTRIRRTIWGRLGMIGTAGQHADRAFDHAQLQVFRVLWLFLPEPSIARDVRFQHLLLSRFLSEGGQQTLTFGALVAVASTGGSAFEVAVIGVAALLPPALLGLYGGIVADQLPTRLALAGAYVGQALICFAIPLFFDTSEVAVLFVLIFAVNSLAQVSAPTESSVLPLVANEEELASAAALINLAVALGQGVAVALFAPIVVSLFGVEAAIYLAGLLLLASATRVFDLPVGDRPWTLRLPPMRVRMRSTVRWMVTHPGVGSMLIVSVLAGTVNVVLVTLAPRYVEAVLNTDATNTAYVFAPSALGVGIALVSAPAIIRRIGERTTAIIALGVCSFALFLLGLVDELAPIVDAVNPLQIAERLGLDLSSEVRTAGLLAIPLAFGVSLTATSVQTYINRRVPIPLQGRTFALQGVLRNGAAIIPLLTLGAAAGALGADTVLLISPFLILGVGYTLVSISFRVSGLRAPRGLQVVESFWEEPPLAPGNEKAGHRRGVDQWPG
jgi:Major Facilitator Superfamily